MHLMIKTVHVRNPGIRGGVFFVDKQGGIKYGRKPQSSGSYKDMKAGKYIRGDIVEFLIDGEKAGFHFRIVSYDKNKKKYIVTFPRKTGEGSRKPLSFDPCELGDVITPSKYLSLIKKREAVKSFGEQLIYMSQPMRLVINKAHVKQHLRRTKTGKLVSIKEHEDSRKQYQPKPMSLKQGSYIIDLLGFSQFREIKKEFLKHFNPDTGKTDISSHTASRLINAVNDYYGNPKKGKIELLRIQGQF